MTDSQHGNYAPSGQLPSKALRWLEELRKADEEPVFRLRLGGNSRLTVFSRITRVPRRLVGPTAEHEEQAPLPRP